MSAPDNPVARIRGFLERQLAEAREAEQEARIRAETLTSLITAINTIVQDEAKRRAAP